jgi:hypothetical protein
VGPTRSTQERSHVSNATTARGRSPRCLTEHACGLSAVAQRGTVLSNGDRGGPERLVRPADHRDAHVRQGPARGDLPHLTNSCESCTGCVPVLAEYLTADGLLALAAAPRNRAMPPLPADSCEPPWSTGVRVTPRWWSRGYGIGTKRSWRPVLTWSCQSPASASLRLRLGSRHEDVVAARTRRA